MLPSLLGADHEWAEPDDVRELGDGQDLEIAGISFVVDHTPGHTQGSVTFRTPYDEGDVSEVMFSGDLLFAGSIGRTDLPGGDHPTMLRSLTDKVLPLRRRHRGAARSRRPDHDRARTGLQPLPARAAGLRRGRPSHAGAVSPMNKPTPLSGFPELLPAARVVERQVRRVAVPQLRAARVRQHRDPGRRTPGPSRQGWRDRQGDLRAAAAPGRRGGRRRRDRPALRPDRAVRALRAGARRAPRVPVPPLPDPAGLARRAAAGGPVPPVHPGRRRHRRQGRAAVPPRRRGDAGDGRRPRRAARPSAQLPVQQPQADPGLLPRARRAGRHGCDPHRSTSSTSCPPTPWPTCW